MGYLIGEIWLWLVIAYIIGLIVGWLIWGLRRTVAQRRIGDLEQAGCRRESASPRKRCREIGSGRDGCRG